MRKRNSLPVKFFAQTKTSLLIYTSSMDVLEGDCKEGALQAAPYAFADEASSKNLTEFLEDALQNYLRRK